ncbi:MAG: hypothetical protein ACRCZF_01560, partial [Gemmataceae bacterium]
MTKRNWWTKAVKKAVSRPATPNTKTIFNFVSPLEDRITPVVTNDNIADAIVIPVGPTPYTSPTVNNATFTSEPGETTPFGDPSKAINSAWWSVTPVVTKAYNINTFTSDFDTTLVVYTASNPANPTFPLTTIDADDDSGGTLQSSLTTTLNAGTTYFVQIAGYRYSTALPSPEFGNIVLNTDITTPPTMTYVHPSFTGSGTMVDGDLSTGAMEAAVTGVNAFATIGAALAAVANNGVVTVNGNQTYAETNTITRPVTLQGVAVGGQAPVITAPFLPREAVGPADDLIHVQTDNVAITGMTFDGNYTMGTGARRAIANLKFDGIDFLTTPVNNLLVSNNTFRELGGRVISVSNISTGSTTTDIVITDNKIESTYGQDDQPTEGAAIFLSTNVFGSVSGNTIAVPDILTGGDAGDAVGIDIQDYTAANTLLVQNNTITVGQGADGVQVLGMAGASTITLLGNTTNAAAGVDELSDGAGYTIQDLSGTGTVTISNADVNTAGDGTFGSGIRVWNAGNGNFTVTQS